MVDVLFVNPTNSEGVYQGLSKKLSAIETPTWSLLLAESCRSLNYSVDILDTNAERLDDQSSYNRIEKINPRLVCFVVYGQNVNSGTTSMSGAVRLINFIKSKNKDIIISVIGSYVQALPKKTIEDEKNIDFIFTNEGVYSLRNVLRLKKIEKKELSEIKGICFKYENKLIFTPPERIVPQENLDKDLPGYAWDLLPFNKKPLDLYRSPLWHAEYDQEKRSPYAAIQTSLGCMFGCNFCMINIINRNDNDEIGVASNYSKMRFWSTEFILKEFDKLFVMGVKTIRIVDEMFMLNPKYYLELCKKLSLKNTDDSLRMWAYSRVDTVKKLEHLKIVRKAGIKWLCLGIESADKSVRLEVSKGKFEDVDIKKIVRIIHDADIDIMANYIFGLPGDDKEKLKKTYDLSVELNTLGWNAYAAMALPGSDLYKSAIENDVKLPDTYEGYSFHSYLTLPLPTEKLSAAEILNFRDQSFINYHTNNFFLDKIKKKFGVKAVENILESTKIKLKRKIIEEAGNELS